MLYEINGLNYDFMVAAANIRMKGDSKKYKVQKPINSKYQNEEYAIRYLTQQCEEPSELYDIISDLGDRQQYNL
jgi:hypothetical protein